MAEPTLPATFPVDRAQSRFKLSSLKWYGCLIVLLTSGFITKTFGQVCSAGPDVTLTCVNGIVPSTSVLVATPVGGTWSNATDNPTVATFTPNTAATIAGNLVAGVYRFIYTTTSTVILPACSDTVQVTIPDCQSLCLPVEVRDTLVCAGTVLNLTDLVTDFSTLLGPVFTIGGVGGTPITNPLTFVADSTMTLTFVASNLLGCPDTTQLTVNVSPPIALAVTDTLVCAGTVLNLTSLVPGFDTLVGPVFNVGGVPIANPLTFVADSTMTLTFVASNLLGCPDTTQLTVNVSPPLNIPLTDTLVCAGTVLNLTNLVPGFDTLLNVGFTAGGIAIANPLAFVADSTTTLTFVASNLLGCSDTTQLTVSVAPLLNLSALVSDTLVCAGTVLNLTSLVPGFDTLLNVGFTAGGVAIANPLAFVADSTTTLTFVASNLLGCPDTTQLTVSVSPPLNIPLTDTLVCAGTVLNLTNLVPGFDTLLNVGFTAGGIAIANPLTFVADSTTTLTLVASNLLGCPDTTQLTVSVSPPLNIPVTDTLVCAGTVLNLTSLVPGFDTLVGPVFTAGGVPIANPLTFVADSTTTLTFVASNLLGCPDTTQLTVNVMDCNKLIDLSLNKLISRKVAALGDTLTYTILVTNEGAIGATGVTVTDSLNAGVQYLGSATTTGSYDPNTKVWTVGNVAAGDTVSLSIRVRVVAQGVWFNTAEISGANEKDLDSTPGNNTAGEDDIDRECFTVPILICRGQNSGVVLTVPAQYTGVVWFRKVAGAASNPVKVAEGNNYTATETELGSYEYTFTSAAGTCPAEGCCPVIVVVEDCCPAQVCVPFTVTKVKTK